MNKKFVINFSVALHFNTFLSTHSDEVGFNYFVERFWREVFLNSRFKKIWASFYKMQSINF